MMPNIDLRVKNLVSEEETRNPFVICQRLGIIVIYSHLIDIRGYCLHEAGQVIINIADDLDEHVAKYVCAHELGHFILHKTVNRFFMDSHTYTVVGKYENEADRFACQLLYSEPPLFEENTLTDWQLAECLNISKVNLDVRMLEMGIYY